MKPKQHFWTVGAIVAIVAIVLASCSTQLQPPSRSVQQTSLRPVTLDKTKVVMGQTVYVPIYSHIYYYNRQDHVMNLSATLSIRNTDLTNPIIITSVRYYDTDGNLVRQNITSPMELKPLASTDFFIPTDDTTGGIGANYIVEWVAEKTVYAPVIEAIMINTSSSQGVSFVSPGKVLKQQGVQN